VTRARQILAMLEAHGAGPKRPLEELPLFAAFAPSAPAAVAEPEIDHALVEAAELIENMDPDSLTPREAHELLYRLKAMLRE
jgi:DNA mismatch repair protein MutS